MLFLVPAKVQSGQSGNGLVNPGFELETFRAGWELNVYGAAPRLDRDTQEVREGHAALRISADAPSDTALGQEIRLKPGRAYQLSGWVKTRGLDARGAPVYGTLQVQLSGGLWISTFARKASQPDWTVFLPDGSWLTVNRGSIVRIQEHVTGETPCNGFQPK